MGTSTRIADCVVYEFTNGNTNRESNRNTDRNADDCVADCVVYEFTNGITKRESNRNTDDCVAYESNYIFTDCTTINRVPEFVANWSPNRITDFHSNAVDLNAYTH